MDPDTVEHNTADVAHGLDVVCGVAFDQDQVGGFSGFECADAIFNAKKLGVVVGAGGDRFQWREAGFDKRFQFALVGAALIGEGGRWCGSQLPRWPRRGGIAR